MTPISKLVNPLLEPPVNDPLGRSGAIRVPVRRTGTPAYWGISPSNIPYVTAQSQEEHNRLLNTFYPQRATMPNWKSRGRDVEKKDPRYTSRDATPRSNIGASSSVIEDAAYDKDKNLGFLKMGNKWHTYNSSPDQFRRFLSSGSLGREMNNINHNKSTSMSKSMARVAPELKGFGSGAGSSIGSIIGSLFGF